MTYPRTASTTSAPMPENRLRDGAPVFGVHQQKIMLTAKATPKAAYPRKLMSTW